MARRLNMSTTTPNERLILIEAGQEVMRDVAAGRFRKRLALSSPPPGNCAATSPNPRSRRSSRHVKEMRMAATGSRVELDEPSSRRGVGSHVVRPWYRTHAEVLAWLGAAMATAAVMVSELAASGSRLAGWGFPFASGCVVAVVGLLVARGQAARS